jgi:hypothetical protein
MLFGCAIFCHEAKDPQNPHKTGVNTHDIVLPDSCAESKGSSSAHWEESPEVSGDVQV